MLRKRKREKGSGGVIMFRWERMYQIFEIMERDEFTVRELFDTLKMDNKNVTINLVDFLLRHYNKNGYLSRSKNLFNIYSYSLSEKGIEQLEWLKDGCQLEYYEYIKD